MMSSKPPAATHLSADLEDGTSEDEQDDIPEEVIENQGQAQRSLDVSCCRDLKVTVRRDLSVGAPVLCTN